MEKISDVLGQQHPRFNTITTDCMVSDALYHMCSENLDYLVVLHDGYFQGVISEHDIASRVLFANEPLNRIEVRHFMNKTLPVAASDNSIQYCLQLMEKYQAGHVAVFDDFEFRGVFSAKELSQIYQSHVHAEDAWDVCREYNWTL